MIDDPQENPAPTASYPRTAMPTKKKGLTGGQENFKAERLIMEAVRAKQQLRTIQGSILRTDLLGRLGSDDGMAESETCYHCGENKGAHFVSPPVMEIKANETQTENRLIQPSNYTYTSAGISMTPTIASMVTTYAVTGYSKKLRQICNACNRDRGYSWHYCPEMHDLSLVQIYTRF